MKDKLNNIKSIGFDMDGALYPETKEIQEFKKNLICKLLTDKDQISLEEAKRICDVEFAKTQSYMYVLEHHGVKDTNKLIHNREINDELIKLINFDLELGKFLKKVKKQYKTFLITHTNKQYAIPRMKKVGIDESHFDFCIFGDSGLLKTSREVFDLVLNEFNLKPNEVLYVGDREVVDIVIPNKIGMLTAIIGSESKLADYQIDSIYNLKEILEK